MALTARPAARTTHAPRTVRPAARTTGDPRTVRPAVGAFAREARRESDDMAVAAFVLGLVGLLVLNIVLGPIAIGLAAIALRRGTARRGRALLGLALGVADLALLAALTTLNGTVSWSLG
ncbi:DUF4190 domain-containing protein [Streptomyces sp. NPDC047928]|uniref:DUF4190 domain-containing protein n=1 Tax=unclassified Streptomyces TaxID=2593676 RepID=UPI0037183A40